jgi:hypothetical protein
MYKNGTNESKHAIGAMGNIELPVPDTHDERPGQLRLHNDN